MDILDYNKNMYKTISNIINYLSNNTNKCIIAGYKVSPKYSLSQNDIIRYDIVINTIKFDNMGCEKSNDIKLGYGLDLNNKKDFNEIEEYLLSFIEGELV